jgi:hypothetical protein
MVRLLAVEAETVTAIATAVMAAAVTVQMGVIIVAAFLTYRQVVATRQQVEEARRLREEQSRPFVVVDLDISNLPLVFLTVSNLGRTIAQQVRIEFDPPLASSFDNRAPTEEDKQAGRPLPPLVPFDVFADEIPSIVPGKVIRTLFDSLVAERREDLPESYRVTVRYEDDRGGSHKEEMWIGFGSYGNLQYLRERTIGDVHRELEKIANTLRQWSNMYGRGLVAFSPADVRRQEAEHRRRFRARPQSSLAPRQASEGTTQWTLRRLRERASRALAIASEKVDPREQ